MFNDLTTLIHHEQQEESEIDRHASGSESDDDIESSATIGKTPRSPPIITWEHAWSVIETRDAWSDSLFANLPTEIIIQIFRLLSIHDLGSISLVCRAFKVIADQNDIWRSKCNPSNEIPSTSFKQIYMDWIYGKYVRNKNLKKMNDLYKKTRNHTPCLFNTCCCSLEYSLQSKSKGPIISVPSLVDHPNSSSDMTIELSVDMDRTIIALFVLMEKTSEFINDWWPSPIIEQMIMRYHRFMQLKASYPNERLVATLDIEIVWQTHLLRPEMYRNDCLRLFRRVIDHSLLIDEMGENLKEQAFANTCRLYEQRYGEHYCPLSANGEENEGYSKYRHSLLDYIECPIPAYSYWDDTCFRFTSNLPNNYTNPFSFVETDVILDSYWFELYRSEMYSVGLKIMIYSAQAQQIALHSAIKRLTKSYERFLYIVSKYSTMTEDDCIHPTYAIDIIWHSHMQEPLKYVHDCNRLLGFIMDHVPWSSTKTTDEITKSCEKINEIWTAEFHRDMETDHLQ